MGNSIKISIIIVSFNKIDILLQTINSVLKYNDLDNEMEIIVIDNSTDTRLFAKVTSEYSNIPNFSIYKNENKGFGHANNRGAKYAKGEILLFLNPDTILIEPIFQYIVKVFKTNNFVASLGVQLVDENLRFNRSFGYIRESIINNLMYKMVTKKQKFNYKKMYISGAALFIRKSVFDFIGGFDERFFLYYEENDLYHRLLKSNFKSIFLKNKKIIHLEGQGSYNEKSFNEQIKSLVLFTNKYGWNVPKVLKTKINYRKIKMIFQSKRRVNYTREIEIIKKHLLYSQTNNFKK